MIRQKLRDVLEEYPFTYLKHVGDCILAYRNGKNAYFKALRKNDVFFGIGSTFDKNGNPLYFNYHSQEEAMEGVMLLEKEGITAYVGSPAPSVRGKDIRFSHPDMFGVYITSEKMPQDQVSK